MSSVQVSIPAKPRLVISWRMGPGYRLEARRCQAYLCPSRILISYEKAGPAVLKQTTTGRVGGSRVVSLHIATLSPYRDHCGILRRSHECKFSCRSVHALTSLGAFVQVVRSDI